MILDKPALIDRIYEAAVIPELWSDVCDSLAAAVDGYSTCIWSIDSNQSARWVSSPHIQDALEKYSRSELRFENVRPGRSIQMFPMSFARDIDVMTAKEIEDDAIYNAFLRPLGVGWSMGSVLPEPSGHTLIFDFMRRTDLGPFEPRHLDFVNSLKGDLARATLISSRMVFQQARSIASALSLVGLPAAVLGDEQQVLAMNDEMEALAPRIRTGAGDRISIDQPQANRLLQRSFELLSVPESPRVQSLPLAATAEEPALVLHVLPVRRNARDIFSRSMAVLMATPVGGAGLPDIGVLAGLFDLTPGEARVARELAKGASIEAVAAILNLSIETVRTYLKRIFLKTGTRRQPELASLLSGLGRVAA
ncbi:DNA-binding CsgD family transcriptional regulator [Pararhizobium capsulatum DSM 1112]|uniref:DNA-binding CsgD family transcriptional regulator n=1 Tax=Pararhizobium capsulatum DSM 1112 TaxID=1121113 RepID=A0ABU0BPW8_9HYPH|nr:helix-turn-helix transcriptional regulator [Pararhizobium capsulatum]MDQ0319794.1 DNA-binding CsgD family transcriptional regulator [Pararhizobium capsulatum DSM 1112]